MNELTRMVYLEALGVDGYVSRRQLPGAAVTRRLAIVPVRPPSEPSQQYKLPEISGQPRTASLSQVFSVAPERSAEPLPRFSLATIVAGDWLWLEILDDLPLATEQVQLVLSMAKALRRAATGTGQDSAPARSAKPDVAQFDWPLHTNRQLDLGEQAARASVAAFVNRRLEQHGCRGVILLGRPAAQRVPLEGLATRAIKTASSIEILAHPARKAQVWLDLQPLLIDP
jgi:hypothetical protein